MNSFKKFLSHDKIEPWENYFPKNNNTKDIFAIKSYIYFSKLDVLYSDVSFR